MKVFYEICYFTIFIKWSFDLAADIKRAGERVTGTFMRKTLMVKVSVMYNNLTYSLSLFKVQLMYNQFSSVIQSCLTTCDPMD